MYDLIIKSQREGLENKRKAIYNSTETIENLQPYENTALTELINSIDKILKLFKK